VSTLESGGQVLIAARTAYFQYKQFETQAKLFRSINNRDVEFAELALDKWDRSDFLSLAEKAGLTDGERLYETLRNRLQADHPLLTRAVLARRLIEEYRDAESRDAFIQGLAETEQKKYFESFVTALLAREANQKWIDKSGEAALPLLTIDEHHALLSAVAEEMWISSTGSLSPATLEYLAELVVGEQLRKSGAIVGQARERISQHALFQPSGTSGGHLEFDHEDFRFFYLGRRLGDVLRSHPPLRELRPLVRVGRLPSFSVRVAASRANLRGKAARTVCDALSDLASREGRTSHVRDNCGQLCLEIVAGIADGGVVRLSDMYFSADSLSAVRLEGVEFLRCLFERTQVLTESPLRMSFVDCELLHLELESRADLSGVEFDHSSIPAQLTILESMQEDDSRTFYDPVSIRQMLARCGAVLADNGEIDVAEPVAAEEAEEIRLAQKAIRLFQRATAINDSVLKLKLGRNERQFFDDVLPGLLRAKVLREEQYKGSGRQRRFRLNAGFDEIAKARASSKGSFEAFLSHLERSDEVN
ncbi:MAG: hypothetical protein KC609_13295, partial [Myxococcales bacterium]|nr:hypothetical protein [Myxococcales bacterium]